VLPLVASYRPELMTDPLAENEHGSVSMRAFDFGAVDRLLANKTVVALGPGISTDTEAVEFVRRIVPMLSVPLVLDADGLNAFAGKLDLFKPGHAGAVLTPHPGEAARLLEIPTADIQKQRILHARELARRSQAVVVLKGHRTVCASPDGRVFLNPTGNPGMATGGSGDVLTGITAGLLAQFPDGDRLQLVAGAVYLHGLAGDRAASELGEMSLVATDITRYLGRAIAAVRSSTPDELPYELRAVAQD
jgi:NAD(P)H-hydrate epimerase